jgi:hypothetical protein
MEVRISQEIKRYEEDTKTPYVPSEERQEMQWRMQWGIQQGVLLSARNLSEK